MRTRPHGPGSSPPCDGCSQAYGCEEVGGQFVIAPGDTPTVIPRRPGRESFVSRPPRKRPMQRFGSPFLELHHTGESEHKNCRPSATRRCILWSLPPADDPKCRIPIRAQIGWSRSYAGLNAPQRLPRHCPCGSARGGHSSPADHPPAQYLAPCSATGAAAQTTLYAAKICLKPCSCNRKA